MSKHEFENLVFEGGGVRAFAYIGAIEELSSLGLLHGIKRYAGTSAGALFAAMLVCGFTVNEISNIKNDLSFLDFSRSCYFREIYDIWTNFGLYTSCALEKNLRSVFERKINPDITLSDLYEQTRKDLVIVTCSLNRQLPLYLHHKTHGNVKLIDALASTISVPYIFQPRKMYIIDKEEYFVDGGVVDNYPIWVFNDLDALYNNSLEMVDKDNIDIRTLGLKLLTRNEMNSPFVYNGYKEVDNIFRYSMQIINTMMIQIERSNISESYIKQTVSIPTDDINFSDFGIDNVEIEGLILNGRKHTRAYFN